MSVVTNSRSRDRAQKTVDEIEADGGTGIAIEADISVRSDVEELVDKTIDEFGSIDVFVNNAGIESVVPAMEITPEEWQAELDINLTGTLFCVQAAGNRMIEQGTGGQIVNVSSFVGKTPLHGRAAYCVTKSAVDNLTKVLAVELAEHDVHVNAIAPGYIGGADPIAPERIRIPEEYDPDASRKTGRGELDYALGDEQAVRNRIPLGRQGSVNEIANCVAFLASGGHYVTGEVLTADGGVLAFGWGSKEV
jgi:3-oxoacyl-[acyl-carrier protein] reductase